MMNLFETRSKSVPITKEMVWSAYKRVRSNQGSPGVDRQSLDQYATRLSSNLYKLWNRMASGSYFPQPVREVTIPKSNGGDRKLGIPTINDRIAQEVIRAYLEPRLERIFVEDSYGYRPHKSAQDAVRQVRANVYRHAWVIDMDIASFFDEVDHDLLQKALDKHVPEQWVKLYINRWLSAPVQQMDGTLVHKEGKGTPQGGVISPLLANLFLHYVLDVWMKKHYPKVPMVRYADDVIVHCSTEREALSILQSIKERLLACKLRHGEEKTRIVCCRSRKNTYPKKFDFLGFTYKPAMLPDKAGAAFLGTWCGISVQSGKRIVASWRKQGIHRRSGSTLQDIADLVNPLMRGVIQYYGNINLSSLRRLATMLQHRLSKWAVKKYRMFKGSIGKAWAWMGNVKKSYPTMFYHWTLPQLN